MMNTPSIAGFRSLPLKISQLSLPAVLKCGQSFRWQSIAVTNPENAPTLPTQEWRLTLSDRVVCLRQTPTTIFYKTIFPPDAVTSQEERDKSTLAWIRDYFQLDIDLEELYEDWSKRDPVFAKVKDRFSGIRMLRQDPFENVISFICSQNNHISRITSMVQNLCIHFSPQLLTIPSNDDAAILVPFHPFPPPSALAHPSVEATLRGLGFGYRAKYIQKTAALLCETHADPMKWLMSLRKLEVDVAREELLKLHGVGPKVADCILLMSMDKASVVPVDTHVYQIAVKHYGFRGSSGVKPNMTPKLYLDVATKLTNIWGEYAGWAHSVLFAADLKSFANYGKSESPITTAVANSPATIVSTESPGTPSKRKRTIPQISSTTSTPTKRIKKSLTMMTLTAVSVALEAEVEEDAEDTEGVKPKMELTEDVDLSLVERVKSRRRSSRGLEQR